LYGTSGHATTRRQLLLGRERSVEQAQAVEGGPERNVLDFVVELLDFDVDVIAFRGAVGVRSGLHSQVAHTDHHVLNLIQRTFSGLDHGRAIVGIAHGLVETAICACIFSLMARPAASSAARLMRKPDDRRAIEVCRLLLLEVRLFWALKAAMFVWMESIF